MSESDTPPRSWGSLLPGNFFSFLATLFSFWENPVCSKSWKRIWLSLWTLVILFESLSILKLISSNLLVKFWNWDSISESFSKCLVRTSSEFWSRELLDEKLSSPL